MDLGKSGEKNTAAVYIIAAVSPAALLRLKIAPVSMPGS